MKILILLLCGVALGGFWAIGSDPLPDEPLVVTAVDKPTSQSYTRNDTMKAIENDVSSSGTPMVPTIGSIPLSNVISVTTPSTILATCVNVPSQSGTQ